MNELLLLSGADIPFVEATATIHQPRIYEISLMGEDSFFDGCQLLKISKDNFNNEDKIRLSNYTDFNILMSIMRDKSGSMQHSISCAQLILELIFPQYDLIYNFNEILLRDRNTAQLCGKLDDTNFLKFQQILNKMFCLSESSSEENYNTQGTLAKEIAEKFRKRKQQLATLKSDSKSNSIFSRYISILTVGEHKDINSFMQYTVYQLFDEFQRYELKMHYDMYIKARMAGAKDLKEPENWMKDIHS